MILYARDYSIRKHIIEYRLYCRSDSTETSIKPTASRHYLLKSINMYIHNNSLANNNNNRL